VDDAQKIERNGLKQSDSVQERSEQREKHEVNFAAT
jgi:hypothetical protein